MIGKRVAAFEAANPEIDVKLLHIPENYFQKLHILVAGGLTPDVMFVNSLSFPMYAAHDVFQPLEDNLSRSKEIEPATFFPAALEAFRWKGTLYAMPRDVSDLVVYYNQDLFDKAGVPYPQPGWTLTDLNRFGRKLVRDEDGDGVRDLFAISFAGKPPLMWLPYVWSEGGDLLSGDLKKLRLAEPAAVSALQAYADIRNKTHLAPGKREVGSATMSQLFLQGKLAMFVSGRWSVPVFRQQAKFRWDVAPFPAGRAGSVVGIDASGYAMARTTRYPEASWKLIMFLSSRASQAAFTESGLIVPARRDVAESPVFLDGLPPKHGRYFIRAMDTGYPTRVPERWDEVAETLGLALDPVWEGRVTAGQAVRKAAPAVEKLLR